MNAKFFNITTSALHVHRLAFMDVEGLIPVQCAKIVYVKSAVLMILVLSVSLTLSSNQEFVNVF
jgi:hypothetical protein